jgi:uncharacterized membrane protein YphA (DoxX/SURF4 family)
MKIFTNIAGILLGLLFIMAGVVVLFHIGPQGTPPAEGSHEALFFTAFAGSGWMTFVKVLEIVGGLLTAIPKTRNFGLLILGPILVNILAFHIFIGKGAHLADPMLIVICLLAAFLLWAGRGKFAQLAN